MAYKKLKVVWISDLDSAGSGYLHLTLPLCDGLSKLGHEVKVIGLGNKGDEHRFPFSIIPVQNLKECLSVAQNLLNVWGYDVMVVALDIPIHEQLLRSIPNRNFKYVGIMPVESDPLCLSWAMVLMQMDKVLIISQFGTDEAEKVGVSAEHIQIGIDTKSWKLPSSEERASVRSVMGFTEETFAVLTVADNQERKNLARSMEIFADFAVDKEFARYVLVTREHLQVGWKLGDYAQILGIRDKMMIFERGISFKELWSIYAACDAFLLASKTEGLNLPMLETMAVGLPALGTNCSGIKELLSDGRGILIDYDYTHIDCFGNSWRYWCSREDGARKLNQLYVDMVNDPTPIEEMTQRATEYVADRKWSIAIDTLERALQDVMNEEIQN